MMNKTVNYSIADVRLLPVDEEPFDVPSHWVWTTLNAILPPMETRDPLKLQAPEFLYIDIDSIDNSIQRIRGPKRLPVSEAPSRAKRAVHSGDVIISLVRPYLKNVALIDEELSDAVASTAFYVCGTSPLYESKYLYQYLRSPFMTTYLIAHTKGDNAPSVRNEDFLQAPIPLPPLDEQTRIVERIESFLEKIEDAANVILESAQNITLFEKSLLSQMWTGELTRRWRERNGIDKLGTWEMKKLSDICISITDGDHQAPPQQSSGIPFLVISNVSQGTLDFSKTRFVSEEYYKRVAENRKPTQGDVLYTVVGSYGIPVVVDTDRPFCFQRHIALLRPSSHIETEYLYFVLRSSNVFSQATEVATGTAQMTVPLTGLRNIVIPVPSLEEQREIESILSGVYKKTRLFRKLLEVSVKTIDSSGQSVLKYAFRGLLSEPIV